MGSRHSGVSLPCSAHEERAIRAIDASIGAFVTRFMSARLSAAVIFTARTMGHPRMAEEIVIASGAKRSKDRDVCRSICGGWRGRALLSANAAICLKSHNL
jgi:hypothetical protein